MKKILSLLLVLIFLFTVVMFTSCNPGGEWKEFDTELFDGVDD